MGSGKSWRTTGILYVFDACSTSGAVRRHIGHSRSSKITMAICGPWGGRSTESTVSCAAAQRLATARKMDVSDRKAKRFQGLFLIRFFVFIKLDIERFFGDYCPFS